MSATATDPARRSPPEPLIRTAERLINGALALDEEARAGLANLAGKRVRIELVPPGWVCTWRVEDGYLVYVAESKLDSGSDLNSGSDSNPDLESGSDSQAGSQTDTDSQATPPPADITLRGGPAAFTRLLVEDLDQGMPGLHLQGEIDTARKLMRVFGRLQIDWEEALAARIGDGPAHRTGRALRGLREWGAETAALYGENTLDYVREERHWLPTEAAWQRQQAALDALRGEVDRLEQRVAALIGRRERADG